MKIGNEVYIHGYIDEIRKDVVIIKNDGGYFGTVPSEIIACEQEPILDKIRAEIQDLRGCSCSNSDGIIDDVEDIIDKYMRSDLDKSEEERDPLE